MQYKISILNLICSLSMIVLAGYTVYNWAVLSHAEGWGVVAMAGLFLVCLAGLFVDFILQLFVKNRWLLNGLEVVFLVAFLFFVKNML